MIYKNHNDLTEEERNFLSLAIDSEFKNQITKPREKALVDFFVSIHGREVEFELIGEQKNIEVLDVRYYANCSLSFIYVAPCYEYYGFDYKEQLEFRSAYYRHNTIEDMVKVVLDRNRVDCSDLFDSNTFDSAEFWEGRWELELEFIVECWKLAKKRANSNLLGFLSASDGSDSMYDLDSGFDFWRKFDSVDDYLKSKGVEMITRFPERKPKERGGFWTKLFGSF